jgi:hypothetical protein
MAISNSRGGPPLFGMSSHRNRASSSSPAPPADFKPNALIETTEQLRIAIDQGQGGSKVDAGDPAAAPLGTDDEAGGAPNSTAQVRLAAAHEVRVSPTSARQRTSGIGAAWWFVGFSILIGGAIIASVVWISV